MADLFGTAEDVRYEAFARGPDLGVDLRYVADDGSWHVVQCKHYLHTQISTLRAAARGEAKKLARLPEKPASYRFVTSRRLTRENKRALKTDLAPYIVRQSDIWGRDDLEILLGHHPGVERRHVKLWLPSSTQLQALLSTGVYSRSRALAEEIVELLPRWVPGRAFFEAREMLRTEGVCVIAGVPGIGKTTLAKMLLANAIDDGYEAIAVSSDIEEAWNVYDPATPQAFYFDDFLGRRVLTQHLEKNEEDRLLMFMRRAAASASTLFILTTREYILQQAQQLYEHFAIEGLEGRKFLLELKDYTRLDRARIFYNHAFFSGQLSAQARRELLMDHAFERIIDHKGYNPRQIEWITGLARHRLTDADNADYMAFAVEALNDPTRIWRHGFEEELGDPERALLYALATLPNRVEHDDLARAFAGFCKQAGIATHRRAFERALKVVDDSFIRTYHDQGEVFISLYDPSVEDFLAGYLAESPSDAEFAVRGAVFFEQIEALARVLRAPEIPPEPLAGPYIDAVMRCLDAPSCSWQNVYIGTEATEPTPRRRLRSPEARVDFIGRIKSWGTPYSDEPLRSRIDEFYTDNVETLRAAWEDGRGSPDEALGLLSRMSSRGEDIAEFAQAASRLVTRSLYYASAFRRVLRLRELAPEVFDKHEWDELRSSYRAVAGSALESWGEMDGVEEIDDIVLYGHQMGVEIDFVDIDEVRIQVERRISEAENSAANRARSHEVEEEPDLESDQQAIERLFIRLAGG